MKINENNEVVEFYTGEILYPIISNPIWTVATTGNGEIKCVQTHLLDEEAEHLQKVEKWLNNMQINK